MLPHERSLVKKYRGKPFALLGVNEGDRVEVVRQQEEEGFVTWRNFRDAEGADGSIYKQWNINMFPAIYIIDAKGIIRYVNPQSDGGVAAVETAIKTLLVEMGEDLADINAE